MPTPKTYSRAFEAAEAPQTSPYIATTVADKGTKEAQNLVEQAARTVQTVVQQAGQNLDLALQLAGTATSGYQSVQAELAGQARQAVQRTRDALSQASQVRSPTALLDLQGSYLTDSLRAVLASNARLAEIAADVARQTAGKLQPHAA
jgi:N-acetylglucosamine kinase-like BadF-type ATPase